MSIEPENHPLEIVRGFSKVKLTFRFGRGHAPYETQYQNELHSILESKRVIFLGAIWDQNLLNSLYANSHSYLHGHSVGGTNPSLLRAIANGAQVIAFESPFNREVLESFGIFFRNESDLVRIFSEMQMWNESMENEVEESRLQILKNYNWDGISEQYKKLIGRALGIL